MLVSTINLILTDHCDHTAGKTDRYAINLYNKLNEYI